MFVELLLAVCRDGGNVNPDVEQSLSEARERVQKLCAQRAMTAAVDDHQLPVGVAAGPADVDRSLCRVAHGECWKA